MNISNDLCELRETEIRISEKLTFWGIVMLLGNDKNTGIHIGPIKSAENGRGRDSPATQIFAVAKIWSGHQLTKFSAENFWLRCSNLPEAPLPPVCLQNEIAKAIPFCKYGGGEIRTRDAYKDIVVFKTTALDRYATPPCFKPDSLYPKRPQISTLFLFVLVCCHALSRHRLRHKKSGHRGFQ